MEASTAQQPPPETEQAALVALALLILSGAALSQITPQALPIFQALGIGPQAATLALSLIPGDIGYPQQGLASMQIARTAAPRRAAYLLSAARRLEQGGSIETERTYLAQHVGAERARIASASKVDRMVAKHGPVLGWSAKDDAITTPDCRFLDRKNFHVLRPPDGTYPGARHGGACRCSAVPPYPGARLLA